MPNPPNSVVALRPIAMARPRYSEVAIERVADAIRRGAIAAGPIVHEFEQRLAACLPHRQAVACANGTAALHAALWALGAGPGTTVVTTSFSFVASASAIVHCGASPVFCDIDDSCNLNPARLEQVITDLRATGRAPVAVIFVHLYGNPTNVAEVAAVCDRHGVALVEDCAQAFGAALPGQPVASFGRVATFSFYATKNVAAGEGGALISPDPELIARVRKFINHGRVAGYAHELIGYNYRMTDLHAILAIDQLDHFQANQQARTANARALLATLGGRPELGVPRTALGATHTYHQFTLTVPPDLRSALISHLAKDGIQSTVYYPIPLPQLECFGTGSARRADFPAADRASRSCLSLPVHPSVDAADRERICDSVLALLETAAGRTPGSP